MASRRELMLAKQKANKEKAKEIENNNVEETIIDVQTENTNSTENINNTENDKKVEEKTESITIPAIEKSKGKGTVAITFFVSPEASKYLRKVSLGNGISKRDVFESIIRNEFSKPAPSDDDEFAEKFRVRQHNTSKETILVSEEISQAITEGSKRCFMKKAGFIAYCIEKALYEANKG